MRGRSLLVTGFVSAMIALFASAAVAAPIQLDWQDLMPGASRSDNTTAAILGGVVEHGEMTALPSDSQQTALVTAYNGEQVRLPGYVLPLEFDGAEVREFLLVPYVGACIHVPPPPPNQIVYVTSEVAVPVDGMFEPVWVTGVINTASLSNELADIGYQMTADLVEPYE